MATYRSLKISYLIGSVRQPDAMSNIFLQHQRALFEFYASRHISIDCKTYTQYDAMSFAGTLLANCQLADVIADPHFQESDIIIFHYGIYYELFEALQFCPNRSLKCVLYQGITPPAVYPRLAEALENSYKKLLLCKYADLIFTTSETNIEVLDYFDLKEKVTMIPLFGYPPISKKVPERGAATSDIRLALVGRFVECKGVTDLFTALAQWDDRAWKLDVIAATIYSDSDLLKKYQHYSYAQWGNRVSFCLDIKDEEKIQILESTDILIVPSHHEGFCMPLIEALHFGCALVHSDAGSIPEIACGMGIKFHAGDPNSLLLALIRAVEARRSGMYATDTGVVSPQAWTERAQKHVEFYSYDNFKQRICTAIHSNLPEPKTQVDDHLARYRVLAFQSIGASARKAGLLPQYMIREIEKALFPVFSTQEVNLQPEGVQPVPPGNPTEDEPAQYWCKKANSANEELMNYFNSRSWKITLPLRFLASPFIRISSLLRGKEHIYRKKDALKDWQIIISVFNEKGSRNNSEDYWKCVTLDRQRRLAVLKASAFARLSAILRSLLRKPLQLRSTNRFLIAAFKSIIKKLPGVRKVVSERNGLRSELEALVSERNWLRSELEALVSEQNGLRSELEAVVSERNGLRSELEAVVYQ